MTLFVVCLAIGVGRAAAQAPQKIGIRAFAAIDFEKYAPSKTFDAVLGKSQFTSFGGGVEVDRVFKRVFVRFGVSKTSQAGTRVFVYNGQVFSLGIPLTMTLTPIEISAGFQLGHTGNRLRPYVGAGLLRANYTETSKFADSGEDVSQSTTGALVFGGANIALGKWVSAAFEAQYRSLPGIIGTSGTSAEFKESNLGGVVMRVLFSVGK
jgi:hypothetical protein